MSILAPPQAHLRSSISYPNVDTPHVCEEHKITQPSVNVQRRVLPDASVVGTIHHAVPQSPCLRTGKDFAAYAARISSSRATVMA